MRRAASRRQSRCRSTCPDSSYVDVSFQKLIVSFSGCYCRWRNRAFFDSESIQNHLFPHAGAALCCSKRICFHMRIACTFRSLIRSRGREKPGDSFVACRRRCSDASCCFQFLFIGHLNRVCLTIFTAGHADATAVLLQVPSVSHLTAFHSALTPMQLGANIKAISAGFPFGVERIMTSAECSEALENWKRRDL